MVYWLVVMLLTLLIAIGLGWSDHGGGDDGLQAPPIEQRS